VEEAAVEEVVEPVFEEEQPEIPEPVPVAAEVEALAAEEVAEEAEAEEPEPVLSKVEGLLVHLEDAPRDFGARLDLARAYRQNADWDAAIDQYERLIGARKFLHAVVDDLKALVEEDVRPARVYHLMGDALMHQDQLDEALEMYRKARKVLVQR
jgi:tetratricopeptide (TPR) repeat protein